MAADPVAGRLVVGLAGTSPSPAEGRWIVRHRPAGVILFARNVAHAAQLRDLCRTLRDLLPPHGEIVADHEGGAVSILAAALGRPPAPWCLGVLDDPDLTRRVHRETGRRLRTAGVTRVLAPCADVLVEPRNPVIGARAFAAEADRAARHVAAAVSGLRAAGVSVCLKHWPGHGGTTGDSHDGAAPAGRGLLPEPFAAGLAAGADALLLGHLADPDRGEGPATLEAGAAARARALAGDRPLRLLADDVTMGALRPALRASLPPDDAGSGLLEPGDLPRDWFAALARGGCDLLLCRGIPWRAFPGPEPPPGGGPVVPEGGLARRVAPESAVPLPTATEPAVYAEARRRLARRAGAGTFPPPRARLIWLDLTPGDRWGEADALGPALAAAGAAPVRWAAVGPVPPGPWSALLLTSHRPRPAAELAGALPPDRLAPAGEALAMGHPALGADLRAALPEGWRVREAYDVRCADLAPLLPDPS